MNKETKRLTWKYFWQQKYEEIFPLLILIIGSSIFMALIYLGATAEGVENWQGILLSILSSILLIGIFVVVMIVSYTSTAEWIKDNWKKAKRRSVEEIKRRNSKLRSKKE